MACDEANLLENLWYFCKKARGLWSPGFIGPRPVPALGVSLRQLFRRVLQMFSFSEMKISEQAMDLAKIKREDRDFCAHLIVRLVLDSIHRKLVDS